MIGPEFLGAEHTERIEVSGPPEDRNNLETAFVAGDQTEAPRVGPIDRPAEFAPPSTEPTEGIEAESGPEQPHPVDKPSYAETAERWGIALTPEEERELESLSRIPLELDESEEGKRKHVFNHPGGLSIALPEAKSEPARIDFVPVKESTEYNHPPEEIETSMQFARDLLIAVRQTCLLVENDDVPPPSRLEGATNKELTVFAKRLGFKDIAHDKKTWLIGADYQTVREKAFSRKTTDTIAWIDKWLEDRETKKAETAKLRETADRYGENLDDEDIKRLRNLAEQAKKSASARTDYDFAHPSGLYILKLKGRDDVKVDYTPQEYCYRPNDPNLRALFSRDLIRATRDFFLATEAGLLEKPSSLNGESNADMAKLAVKYYGFTLTGKSTNDSGGIVYHVSGKYETIRDCILSDQSREAEKRLNEKLNNT